MYNDMSMPPNDHFKWLAESNEHNNEPVPSHRFDEYSEFDAVDLNSTLPPSQSNGSQPTQYRNGQPAQFPHLPHAWDTSRDAATNGFDSNGFISQMPTVPKTPPSDDQSSDKQYITTHTPHAWLDRYVEHSRELSPRGFNALHEATGLWTMATTIAGRAFVNFGGKKRSTALMFVAIARSSVWAKSHTIGVGNRVLSDAGLDWRQLPSKATPQAIVGILSDNTHVLELLHQIEVSEDEKEKAKLNKQLDFLKKKIGRLYAHEGQRSWHISEFGTKVIAGMMRAGSALADFSDFLRDINDKEAGKSYNNATRSYGAEVISSPFLAVIADTTPADIRQYARAGAPLWSNGFLPRFNLIAPLENEKPSNARVAYGTRHQKVSPYELTSVMVEVDQRLGSRHNYIQPLPMLDLEYSYDIWDDIYNYEDWLKTLDLSEDLAGNIVRLAVERVPAIAATLAIFDGCAEIQHQHCQRAIEICERIRVSTEAFYTRMTRHSVSEQEARKSQREDRILKIIEKYHKKKNTWPTSREIRIQTGSNRFRLSNEDLGKVLDVLKDANLIEEFKKPKAKAYRYKIT